MRRIGSPGCARAISGHAATPPTSDMNSRRLIAFPEAKDKASYPPKLARKGVGRSAFAGFEIDDQLELGWLLGHTNLVAARLSPNFGN
jgi:hypothetical protein